IGYLKTAESDLIDIFKYIKKDRPSATKIIGDKIFFDIYLLERPRLSGFSFTGVSKSEADDLREEIKLIKGSQVTDNIIINTKNTIKKFYVDKGYLKTFVSIQQDEDTAYVNKVVLQINVHKNERVKINDIIFEGDSVLKENKLWRAMKETKRKKWYNLFKPSKLIDKKYEDDKKKIIEKYNELGYRDARILDDSIYFNDDKTINIVIKISEGPKYYFRNITWVGNSKYSSDALSQVLNIKKGDVFDQSVLDKRLLVDEDAVSSLYLDNGYLFFSVTPVEVNVENDSIDIEMRIIEGKQARINRVTISGNTKTNEHVIRREIRTKPGQLFSRSDIIRSHRELAQLGYFDPEKLDVTPVPNPADGTVDLEYTVEEKPSDQIELSGGWGQNMVVGTLGLVFNNFSIRNVLKADAWRPLPSGDGQKLSLRAQTNGTYYQSYSLSFVEPWLGGKKPNSFSVSAYRSIRNYGGYYSTSFAANTSSMKVTGVAVGLGRRLTWPDDFFILSHELSYQQYNLSNYGTYFIFSDGKSNNISFKTTFSRNSVDQPIYPRRGSLLSLSLQLTPPFSLLNNKDYSVMTDQEKYKWIEYHKWTIKSSWFTSLVGKLV
ncbi:MAG: BamA/TamA family outer membrane protein, partial [Chlorobi bacterium]|nr:BamA/TamA family outer membrane protein [Chlorobiota bacterium]